MIFKKILIASLFLSEILFAQTYLKPTQDNGGWFFLNKKEISLPVHNTQHFETFGKYVNGYNALVLKSVDAVQQKFPDGGGYFIGIHAKPAESPIGYDLKLFGKSLITPPRKSSYCSGSTYTVFIETLNRIFNGKRIQLSEKIFEAMRMQEPNGGRREDFVKFWGNWNADGPGDDYALVQYSQMGKRIKPNQARSGDFVNISWKKGGGHSVIFLGWYRDENDSGYIYFWSSQRSTNGLGDKLSPIGKIQSVVIVRLTKPQNLFNFDVNAKINKKVKGDKISFPKIRTKTLTH